MKRYRNIKLDSDINEDDELMFDDYDDFDDMDDMMEEEYASDNVEE